MGPALPSLIRAPHPVDVMGTTRTFDFSHSMFRVARAANVIMLPFER